MSKNKYLILDMRHESGADPTLFVTTSLERAAKRAYKFFKSYGFEIKDGRPFDPGNDDEENGGYEVFSDVKLTWPGPEVLEFTHCEGEGPCCQLRESENKY